MALRLLRLAALAPLALLLAAYLFHPGFRSAIERGVSLLAHGDLEALREWGEGLGLWAAGATFVLMVVQAIAAPLPAVLVTATNSLLFGPFVGGVHSILSANVAAVICYLVGSALGHGVVARLVSKRALARADRFMEEHGVVAVLAARLMPVVPFDPISYVAGVVRMRLWPFFWATLVGQIPAGMAYSYLFQEVDHPARFVATAACVFAALLLVGWTCRRALLGKRKSKAREQDSDPDED